MSSTTSPFYTQAPITQYGPERTIAAATLDAPRPGIRSSSTKDKYNYIGVKLHAVVGTWTKGTTLSHQWTREGTAIKGATNSSYVPVPADHNKRLKLSVTGHQPGYTTRTLSSIAVKPLLRTQPTHRIKTSGVHRSGHTLKAIRDSSAGSWVKGTKTTYQWYRNGKAIKGATKSSYKIRNADRRTTLKVRATGTKYAYSPATASVSVKLIWG